MKRSPLQLSAWVVIAAIIILMAAFVAARGYTTPRYDEWWTVHPLVIAAVDGNPPSLAQIAAPANGHRHLFPNLLGLSVALATRYTGHLALVMINYALLVGMFALVVALFRHLKLPDARGWVFVLIALLLFAPVQAFNLLFGFQRVIWFMMAGGYLCIYAVGRWGTRWPGWITCLIGTVFASWSFFGGNALWLIVPIGMFLHGERRLSAFTLWGGALIVHLALYLPGYELVQAEAQQNTLLHILLWNPLAALGGLFVNAPLTYDFGLIGYLAAALGAVGVILLIALLISASRLPEFAWRRITPLLMAILFTGALVAMVTLGRNSIEFHSLVSRFTTFSVPFWIGVIGIFMAVRQAAGKRRSIRFVNLTAVMLIALCCAAVVPVWGRYLEVQADPAEAERCFLSMDSRDCLITIYGTDTYITVDDMAALIDELRARRLSLFSREG